MSGLIFCLHFTHFGMFTCTYKFCSNFFLQLRLMFGILNLLSVFRFILFFQVRSLAAESFRAYQGGPLEPTFYQEASASTVEMEDLDDFVLPSEYACKLDWFSVDLEGEHSAMDGRILEEHTEYVVYAIHRVSLFLRPKN